MPQLKGEDFRFPAVANLQSAFVLDPLCATLFPAVDGSDGRFFVSF